MPTPILFSDIEQALLWTSSPSQFEASAFVSRSTGKVYFGGADQPVDEENLPADIEDSDEYVRFPHKNELDLGRGLIFRFVDEHATFLAPRVREAFRHKGAYARFKNLLVGSNLLDRWHDYENRATRAALERWAHDNGFAVQHAGGGA